MLEKTRSIGRGQRRGIKDVGPKHRDARLIYGERGDPGRGGQPKGNTGKKNSLEGGVMPGTGTACQILVLSSFEFVTLL